MRLVRPSSQRVDVHGSQRVGVVELPLTRLFLVGLILRPERGEAGDDLVDLGQKVDDRPHDLSIVATPFEGDDDVGDLGVAQDGRL